jgi:archaetidylinositol phosphate synthase
MIASPEPEEAVSAASLFSRAGKVRPGYELLTEVVFRPLAHAFVRVLLPLRVPPTAVLLANAVAGVAAAAAILRGELVQGALLLQVKTVLDNADGQLARAAGRTTALGRYLDTEADFAVNAILFAALAHETGEPLLSFFGFCALTLVLSADFNADVLYRRARGEDVVTQPTARGEGRVAVALARLYSVVFGPQDRALQAVSRSRQARLLTGVVDPQLVRRATLAYHDRGTVAVLANLGLSTQLVALGICLVAGAPTVYLGLVLACALSLPVLQLRREVSARRALVR